MFHVAENMIKFQNICHQTVLFWISVINYWIYTNIYVNAKKPTGDIMLIAIINTILNSNELAVNSPVEQMSRENGSKPNGNSNGISVSTVNRHLWNWHWNIHTHTVCGHIINISNWFRRIKSNGSSSISFHSATASFSIIMYGDVDDSPLPSRSIALPYYIPHIFYGYNWLVLRSPQVNLRQKHYINWIAE